MKRRCRLAIVYLSIFLFIAILLLGISTLSPLPTKTCAWCHEPFTEEGTQLEHNWYDDDCWSKLRKYSGEIFGREWHRERIEWILEITKERWTND